MKTSRIMCTSKTLTDSCSTKQKGAIKNNFATVVNNVFTEHKDICLSINGA